jgi:hypothetical protein
MTKAIAVAAALIALTASAAAQIWLMSPGGRAFGTTNSAPLTPCGTQQFDFSDSTGCQLLSGIETLEL